MYARCPRCYAPHEYDTVYVANQHVCIPRTEVIFVKKTHFKHLTSKQTPSASASTRNELTVDIQSVHLVKTLVQPLTVPVRQRL